MSDLWERFSMAPPVDLDKVPREMCERSQWVMWKNVVRRNESQPSKLPVPGE